MGKAELLSPAGNFDALKGAINAGADAVYLGGERYGARAYAENFTTDEICEGIHIAHVFGKKIYLTVNTLVKEKELDDLYYFILPFYEKGLDGVIIQDLGVLRFLRAYFPGLALHASTQMTITGAESASLIQKEGISRIVPARELSLDELVFLKQKTGVEIEAFIHGAMCYCYSGQCLFSSLLGGRSGNRGRCAQPCRLPYQTVTGGQKPEDPVSGKTCYPLSMKDMCTIELLPMLIEAGIDSFKIEGRMKNPAYAAGVTAIYRKYMDLYERDKENYHVAQKDKELLHSLYIRSETGEGYYRKRNGREMISLSSPAYSQTDEALLAMIRQKYIDAPLPVHKARAEVRLKAGEKASLTLRTEEAEIFCQGVAAEPAKKQPLTLTKIEEQLKKTGNSLIGIEQTLIDGAENIFMPVSALNELRRKGVSALEDEIIRSKFPEYADRNAISFSPGHTNAPHMHSSDVSSCRQSSLHVFVVSKEQFRAALTTDVERIYLDYGLLAESEDIFARPMRESKAELYAATPYIVREKDKKYLQGILALFLSGSIRGVLVRNLESMAFFAKEIPKSRIVLDACLYLWNRASLGFGESCGGEFYLPAECNGREWRELLAACPNRRLKASAVVYGRLPMMVTANCIQKTTGKCRRARGLTLLEDRYGKQFPVYSDCLCCYNIIYNSVPLSLHRQLQGQIRLDGNYRLDFTIEKEDAVRQIITDFRQLISHNGNDSPQGPGHDCRIQKPAPFYKEYTTGHFKRGVE